MPPVAVIVPTVKEMNCDVPRVPVPSVVMSMWLRTVSSGSAMVAPLVAWSEESMLAVEANVVSAESFNVLPAPSAVNARAPPGLLATPLRSIVAPARALMYVGW